MSKLNKDLIFKIWLNEACANKQAKFAFLDSFDILLLKTTTIHYGTQLMPSVVFLLKIGDTGMFVYKMNFLLFHDLQELTIS